MAIGRCFEESFQKAIRSLEIGYSGWGCDRPDQIINSLELDNLLRTPSPERIIAIRVAMIQGKTNDEIYTLTKITWNTGPTGWGVGPSNPRPPRKVRQRPAFAAALPSSLLLSCGLTTLRQPPLVRTSLFVCTFDSAGEVSGASASAST